MLCVVFFCVVVGIGIFETQKTTSAQNVVENPLQTEPVAKEATPVEATKPVLPLKPTKYVSLTVPVYYQIYGLSCEAASLEMALAEKGIHKTQDELLTLIGNALPLEKSLDNGVWIWGDPDLGFVGDVKGFFTVHNGGLPTATGWGVSNVRIGEVAAQLRSKSASYFNFTPQQIENEIDAGNPVIFWHRPDAYSAITLPYKTPAGKDVTFMEDHVAVITGYEVIGGITKFLIHDPIEGTYTYTEKGLIRVMSRREGRVVVVR